MTEWKKFLPQSFGGPIDNYWNRIFGEVEEEVIDFYEKHSPYRLSVDVGAGIGYHTRKLAEISEKVIAIEPIKEPELPKNVEFHKVAVGAERGRRKMKVCGTHRDGSEGGSSTFDEEGDVEVVVKKLDDIIQSADFLKVDIEGAENEALKGSKLIKNVDYAVIENHGNFDYSVLPENLDYEERKSSKRKNSFIFCKNTRIED